MIIDDIRRIYHIIRIMINYELDEFIPQTRLTFLLRLLKIKFNIPTSYVKPILGERLRLALQDLGPVWIKLGQMLSTRRDLFSSETINQLEILQDRVHPFNNAKIYIERALGKKLETCFNDFQPQPLAAASIAQVHAAKLKNGKEIIIKVIRPDILPIIKDDIKLMYRLAGWIQYLFANGKRLKLIEIVLEYEKTLLNELNLLRETANAIQLRRNFTNDTILYIPEVYPDFCRETVMVMERIYGIPINDITSLKKQGTNMKLLAERGVQIFFTQVFRDSFFHGDMHPGNIFVSLKHPKYPQYISIDCGIVGSLNKNDNRYLAENFVAFFNRNYRKVAELHIDSGWVPINTNVDDFEFAIRMVCEPIFKKPLAEISFAHVLLNLFNTARQFNMEVQPQLILLQKTLIYIEGIGRQLYPQLDLWKTAKPFLEKWLKDQIGFFALWRTLKDKIPYWAEQLPALPELMYNNFKQQKFQKNIECLLLDIKIQNALHSQSQLLFNIGTILFLSGIVLLIEKYKNELLPCWLIISGILSWIISWLRTIM